MAFFPDIAPSRMFTTNSLCLAVCPINDWLLFFKFLKVIFLEDDVRNDLRKTKLIKWVEQVQNRLKWKDIVEKAETVTDL